MGCLPRSACLGSLSLTQFPEFNGPWGMFGDQGQPSLFEDQSLHVSRLSRLCAQAQSGDDMPLHKQAYMEYTQLVFCKLFRMPKERHLACPTWMHGFHPLSFQEFILNHGLIPPHDYLFGGDTGLLNGVPNLAKRFSRIYKQLERHLWGAPSLPPISTSSRQLRAMVSPGGSIVASLKNFNGFLAVYTPLDDLISTYFKKKGVVPEIVLHILDELIFLIGRHSFDNEIPLMVVCEVSKPRGKRSVWTSECGFLLIFWIDGNLEIPKETFEKTIVLISR
nr:hypothetical protein [Tanacetum cinerariifolium]